MKHMTAPDESRALAEDPTQNQHWQEQPLPIPARVVQPDDRILSPLVLIVGAVAMLFLIAGLVLQITEADGDQGNASVSANDLSLAHCQVIALNDIDIRIGPDESYARAWILPAGHARVAVGKTADEWFQVTNGWLPNDPTNLIFRPQNICHRLETVQQPTLYDDTIALPEIIAGLNWQAVLSESFATDSHQWYDQTADNDLKPQDGALLLASGMQVFPQTFEQIETDEAFYTFHMEWLVNEPSARLILQIQDHAVQLGSDGQLTLALPATDQVLGEIQLAASEAGVTLGVWISDVGWELFVDGMSVLSIQGEKADKGRYYLLLEGNGAVARIDRFEIFAPQ